LSRSKGRGQTKGTTKNCRKEIKLSTLVFYCLLSIFLSHFFVSPHPHCAGCRLPKIELETLDDNGDSRRRNAKTWAAIFVPHKILLTSLKEGNCRILVGHITNVHC